jgi:phage terminase small subunit
MSVLANPRFELFAQQVALGKSAFEAAIAAGYAPSTANSHVKRLSGNVGIRARIVEIQAQIVERSTWSAARVLERLGEQAEADLIEIQDEKGNFKPVAEWPPHWRKMIQGLEFERKSVRSHDGVQAGESKARTKQTIWSSRSNSLTA